MQAQFTYLLQKPPLLVATMADSSSLLSAKERNCAANLLLECGNNITVFGPQR
jgi:hypothetical protein